MPEGIEIQQVIDLYESGYGTTKVVEILELPCAPSTLGSFLEGVSVNIRRSGAKLICPGCRKEFTSQANSQKLCKECIPDQTWLFRYNKFEMTKPLFDEMYQNQNGLCDFCFEPLPTSSSKIAIDHCHKQGHVRGLLHIGCNLDLAIIEDDKKMANAFRYIERHKR